MDARTLMKIWNYVLKGIIWSLNWQEWISWENLQDNTRKEVFQEILGNHISRITNKTSVHPYFAVIFLVFYRIVFCNKNTYLSICIKPYLMSFHFLPTSASDVKRVELFRSTQDSRKLFLLSKTFPSIWLFLGILERCPTVITLVQMHIWHQNGSFLASEFDNP